MGRDDWEQTLRGFLDAKRFTETEPLLDDAVRRFPENAELAVLHGWCLLELGRFPDALAEARRGAALAPGDPVPRLMLARVFDALDAPTLRAEALEEACSLDPGQDWARGEAERLRRELALNAPTLVDVTLPLLGRDLPRLNGRVRWADHHLTEAGLEDEAGDFVHASVLAIDKAGFRTLHPGTPVSFAVVERMIRCLPVVRVALDVRERALPPARYFRGRVTRLDRGAGTGEVTGVLGDVIFFHRTGVAGAPFESFAPGVEVVFEAIEFPEGLQAFNVRALEFAARELAREHPDPAAALAALTGWPRRTAGAPGGAAPEHRAWPAAASVDPPLPAVKLPLAPGVAMEFLLVPAGETVVSSERDLEWAVIEDEGMDDGEGDDAEEGTPVPPLPDPRRFVITRPFLLARFPVTQAQWRALMGDLPPCSATGDDHPVEALQLETAEAFLAKLQAIVDRAPGRIPFSPAIVRPPTAAEWEHAFRAGAPGEFPWGDEPVHEHAWFAKNSGGTSHPVGRKKPNRWGFHDMAGNVDEICADFAHPVDMAGNAEAGPPCGVDPLAWRGKAWSFACRGGNYDESETFLDCRVTIGGFHATNRNRGLGLRVAIAPWRPVLVTAGDAPWRDLARLGAAEREARFLAERARRKGS